MTKIFVWSVMYQRPMFTGKYLRSLGECNSGSFRLAKM
jgi:hypothetical protein